MTSVKKQAEAVVIRRIRKASPAIQREVLASTESLSPATLQSALWRLVDQKKVEFTHDLKLKVVTHVSSGNRAR